MYYPSLFAPVRAPFAPPSPEASPSAPRPSDPLDLSVKPLRADPDAPDDLLMLDHRKLAALAPPHALMGGRVPLDPSALYRLGGYDALAPPFGSPHHLMTTYLQQRDQAAAFYAARSAAYMDPLHLRNGLTQREAAAALAATRGLYAPALPTPMVLPAFSLYSDDKGAFTSLRSGGSTEKGYLNGTPGLDAARYAEHLQRLREQHMHGAKCSNSCCVSGSINGLGQTCQCCVQTPSQAALCARSPMGCSNKDPASAATGKVCDFSQSGLNFLHRPTATTSAPAVTTTSTSSELKLSVSSLCSTQNGSESTTGTSSHEKQNSGFRAPIWNAGLPTVSNGGKTAFSVPKKKDKDIHSKEHRLSGSIKDILKDNPTSTSSSYDTKPDVSRLASHSGKLENSKKTSEKYSSSHNDDFPPRYEANESFNYHKSSVITSAKSNNHSLALTAGTQNSTNNSIANSRSDSNSLPLLKMPPLLEAVRPSELHPPVEPTTGLSPSVHSPQGPPPLIAVSSSVEPSPTSVIKSPYMSSDTSSMAMYPSSSVGASPYKHHSEKSGSETSNHKSSSSKSPKKPSQAPKYNGLPMSFVNGDLPLAYPKPMIPPKPIAHIPSHLSATFAGHYRPPLQSHDEWIPHASPNVTVAPASTSAAATSSAPVSTAHRPGKSHAVQREPDYADTANVLQSLLIRSAPGIEALPLSSKAQEATLMSTASLPLFSLDYRYPLGPQLKLTGAHDGLPLCGTAQSGADPVTPCKVKPETNNYSSTLIPKPKKRPVAREDDSGRSKKRISSSEFNVPVPRYQPSFTSEASEAPECPYTFVAEPPFSYARHGKPHEGHKPLWREVGEETPSKSPVLVPVKSPSKPQEETPRLLARIRRQRVRIASDLERQLSVRCARRLLSQYTLRWAHRRYLHKWYALRLRRRKKDGRLVCRIRRVDNKTDQQTTPKTKESLVMPPEMKRLMVNKALGETPLHRAARLGYPEAVAYCLQSGCVSVNARDNAGYTPLHECCIRGHLDIARALLQYGADVNASAAGGIRPLHDAVENDHVEVVRLLLSYGADPTIATYSGLEPLKLARSAIMAEFLQGFFADVSGELDCRLPWRFWGSARCLDPEEGCAVFEGLPPDPETECEADSDFLFEVSDAPHLPTFRLLSSTSHHKSQCNFLRLSDVLRRLNMSRDDFLCAFAHIEVLSIPRHEFEASATCSPLMSGPPTKNLRVPEPLADNSATTDLVRLDASIRKVLGIETISVR